MMEYTELKKRLSKDIGSSSFRSACSLTPVALVC